MREAAGRSLGDPTRRGDHDGAVITDVRDRHAPWSEAALAAGVVAMGVVGCLAFLATPLTMGGRQAQASVRRLK